MCLEIHDIIEKRRSALRLPRKTIDSIAGSKMGLIITENKYFKHDKRRIIAMGRKNGSAV